jgi:hypothetical protein
MQFFKRYLSAAHYQQRQCFQLKKYREQAVAFLGNRKR